MAHPHAQLIERFYAAFQERNGDEMIRLYSNDVRFSDPVFPGLVGDRAKAMWKMLTARSTGLRIELSKLQADDTKGSAHWEAFYKFGPAQRPVHNIIDATYVFRDGLIAEHTDEFNFWRWSRQALGISGLLLGWTPMIQNKVRATAAKGLDAFIAK
jgi:hypothetical protein